MDENKIDRLFKEKIEIFEITPAPKSWDEIDGRIGSKSVNWMLIGRVAAAVLIMLSVSLLFIEDHVESIEVAQNVAVDELVNPDPVKESNVEFIADALVDEDKSMITKEVVPMIVVSDPIHTEIQFELPQPDKMQLLTLTSISYAKIGDHMIENQQFEVIHAGSKEPKISITYIAEATPAQEKSSKGKLGKLWQYAKNSSPAEIMADIRDAKDQFLESKMSLD
jgi:hypothetical protein